MYSTTSIPRPREGRRIVFDGKTNREVWQEGDGYGDADALVFERSRGYRTGHPTWKLFMGEVANPIKAGTDEPPHRVYLDDKACHAIITSNFYSTGDLYKYWPYDFGQDGSLRINRPNRGRPAFTDDTQTEFAHVELSSMKRNHTYVFRGGSQEAVKTRVNQFTPLPDVPDDIRERSKAVENRGMFSIMKLMDTFKKPRTLVEQKKHLEALGEKLAKQKTKDEAEEEEIDPTALESSPPSTTNRGALSTNSPGKRSLFHQTLPSLESPTKRLRLEEPDVLRSQPKATAPVTTMFVTESDDEGEADPDITTFALTNEEVAELQVNYAKALRRERSSCFQLRELRTLAHQLQEQYDATQEELKEMRKAAAASGRGTFNENDAVSGGDAEQQAINAKLREERETYEDITMNLYTSAKENRDDLIELGKTLVKVAREMRDAGITVTETSVNDLHKQLQGIKKKVMTTINEASSDLQKVQSV